MSLDATQTRLALTRGGAFGVMVTTRADQLNDLATIAIKRAKGEYGPGWRKISRDARYGAIAAHALSMFVKFHRESTVAEVAGVMTSDVVMKAAKSPQ